jgi:hypothetical protein
MRNPLPHTLKTALTYLRALLSSKDPKHWDELKRGITSTPLWDLPIAQRWAQLLADNWTSIPNISSPMALDRATRQQSVKCELTGTPRNPMRDNWHHQPRSLSISQPLDKDGRINERPISSVRLPRLSLSGAAMLTEMKPQALASYSRGAHPAVLNTTRDPPTWKSSWYNGTLKTAPFK